MKNPIKIFAAAIMLFILNLCAVTGYYALSLPDSYNVDKGSRLELATTFSIDAVETGAVPSFANVDTSGEREASLRLFGVIPVKNVTVHPVDKVMLIPGGQPFGIKLLMEGVMIVDTGGVRTDTGTECPAEDCGLEKGDVIITANDARIESNEDMQRVISDSGGKPVSIVYIHDKQRYSTKLTPVLSEGDDSYKAGLWVRDSTAGIGTMTFIDPATNRFGGLGHPVCDSDTGEIIPISSGETADVKINKVVKGTAGSPGELHGSFVSRLSSGVIYRNNEYGVFGERFDSADSSQVIPMALKQDIKEGQAFIRATIDSGGPKDYAIEIEDINLSDSGTKNMLIRVTDERLLKKTGGIVQGMSGSPIIQDGRLVGAVTHVLINDPQKGYGIFCENMLERGLSGQLIS